MINDFMKKIIFLFSIFYFLFSNIAFNVVLAQVVNQPQFMASWQAQSYVPTWYQGKVFPTKGSRINVAFELIDGDKIADLSKIKVRWYVNDHLRLNEEKGLGIKSYSFLASDYPGQDTEVRIAVVGYKNMGQLDKFITIPVVRPEAVINAPYSDLEISRGTTAFSAYPFFFNISDLKNLSFDWTVNGQPAESGVENQQALDLNIDRQAPSGFVANVGLAIRNLLDEMEFAGNNVKLNVK